MSFSLNQEIMGWALQSLLCYWRTELYEYRNYDITDEQDAEVVKNLFSTCFIKILRHFVLFSSISALFHLFYKYD